MDLLPLYFWKQIFYPNYITTGPMVQGMDVEMFSDPPLPYNFSGNCSPLFFYAGEEHAMET